MTFFFTAHDQLSQNDGIDGVLSMNVSFIAKNIFFQGCGMGECHFWSLQQNQANSVDFENLKF